MSNRTKRQLTSGRISDALDAPPYPVVCQNGSFYAFEVNGRYPTAVTIPSKAGGSYLTITARQCYCSTKDRATWQSN